jgi:Protein of unknown function (DUF2537)
VNRPEPTPWATGLTVTALVAALVAALDLVLTSALAASFGWLAVPANVLIGVGMAPSIWLMHRVPFWRWIGSGVALGLGVAWLGLLVNVIFDAPH